MFETEYSKNLRQQQKKKQVFTKNLKTVAKWMYANIYDINVFRI